MLRHLTAKLSAVTLLALCATPSTAQELVYRPINPSFGGDSFNSSHLLGIAEIHRPDPPQSDSTFAFDDEQSQAEQFAEQLESRLLSRLSTDIAEAIFGPEAEPNGEFVFEDTRITFDTLLDGSVHVTIFDQATGGETVIQVPSFLSAGQF